MSPDPPDPPDPPAAAEPPSVHVLGIRHHGPGSARSVVASLEALRPDAVLIEGPADADPLLALAALDTMVPPVALLAYAPDDPQLSAFWPFAVFSPEWQALRWAVDNGVPVRFCDLPTSAVLAQHGEERAESPDLEPPETEPLETEPSETEPLDTEAEPVVSQPVDVRSDPLALLAAAGGYDDPERWWEDLIESRAGGLAPFDALTEAMAELRADQAAPTTARGIRAAEREERREAHMRQTLRATLAGGAVNVAIVCGAWHAPALTAPLPSAAADTRTLRGLPKRKTVVTWVPWTHSRLATSSGYGAGITSPGWYHHLFTATDLPITRWLVTVAGVLRTHDLPVSSAHVIEAVRLAEALAVVRGRPLAGLAEVTEATRAVLCEGNEAMVELVTREVVVGEAMGEVPPETPMVPLEADLRGTAKRLRLKIEPFEKTLALDLRKDNDLARSHLLHRLRVVRVGWGTPADDTVRNSGTFRETWSLRWAPELSISVVEAALWGTTVAVAAAARLVDTAATATELAAVTVSVEDVLLADLPAALPQVLAALDRKAAADLDVEHLMAALPALVRAMRYGDVRATDTSAIAAVVDALLARICAALPSAVSALGDEAATVLRDRIDGVHGSLELAGNAAGRALWLEALNRIVDRSDVHGLLIGRAVRLLLDAQELTRDDAALRMSRALSAAVPAPAKGAWVEGFLAGGAVILVHDPALLALLDDWVGSLDAQTFTDTVPLLRRTFGAFTVPERRMVGERVASLDAGHPTSVADEIDEDLARDAIATAALLLGVGA